MGKPKNHKENCSCGVCKSIRGETKGENNACFRGGHTYKKYYCKICGKEIGYRSVFKLRGLCRKHCFDEETRSNMSKARIGKIPWNKGKKGFMIGYWLGKSNKNILIKHHIDGNKKNNNENNFLQLKQGLHRSLHWKGYEYLVKITGVYEYLKEFCFEYNVNDVAKEDCKVVHHIDCNRENNHSRNLLYLKDKKIHNKLHQEAYKYLVRINKVNDYISWFLLKEEGKLPKTETKEELNSHNLLKIKEI